MDKTIINTPGAPAPIGPYKQAILAGNMLFISGQIPIDSTSGDMKQADATEETQQVMKNLEAILTDAGMKFEDVVKTSIFLTDMGDFAKVNAVYATYFPGAYAPARETVQVCALPKGAHVEISMIACK